MQIKYKIILSAISLASIKTIETSEQQYNRSLLNKSRQKRTLSSQLHSNNQPPAYYEACQATQYQQAVAMIATSNPNTQRYCDPTLMQQFSTRPTVTASESGTVTSIRKKYLRERRNAMRSSGSEENINPNSPTGLSQKTENQRPKTLILNSEPLIKELEIKKRDQDL